MMLSQVKMEGGKLPQTQRYILNVSSFIRPTPSVSDTRSPPLVWTQFNVWMPVKKPSILFWNNLPLSLHPIIHQQQYVHFKKKYNIHDLIKVGIALNIPGGANSRIRNCVLLNVCMYLSFSPWAIQDIQTNVCRSSPAYIQVSQIKF